MGSNPTEAPLIVVVGETASGKTAASIKIAQEVGGEIICADSRTVYQQMDIGTAKPSIKEQSGVPHHLLDVVRPDQKFNASKFQSRAIKCIQEISKRGRVPIMVGGTGLYIDSVLYNFQFISKPDEAFRAYLEQMNDEELTTLLNTKNIETDSLNTKNRRHVIRAIERGGMTPENNTLRANTLTLGLTLEREVLKERIRLRVEQMFEDGFLDEVKKLSEEYGWEHESMSGIGYRAVKEYLEGSASLNEVKEAFIRGDLNLAKRQRTWFKRNKSIVWFDNPEALIVKAVEFANSFDYN